MLFLFIAAATLLLQCVTCNANNGVFYNVIGQNFYVYTLTPFLALQIPAASVNDNTTRVFHGAPFSNATHCNTGDSACIDVGNRRREAWGAFGTAQVFAYGNVVDVVQVWNFYLFLNRL